MNHSFDRDVVETLLGRPLLGADGIAQTRLLSCEQRLGRKLPAPLRGFYSLLGSVDMLTASFNRFIPPEELLVQDNWMNFLEENQAVCHWAIKMDGTTVDENVVFQTQDQQTYFSEDIDLDYFLTVFLYYQLAQGGYQHCAALDIEQTDQINAILNLVTTDKRWTSVVDHNRLCIYSQSSNLVWFFTDANKQPSEQVFVSCLLNSDCETFASRFGFTEI